MHFHCSCICNGGYFIHSIKTGNTHKQQTLPQTVFNTLKKCDGGGIAAQSKRMMVVAFTMTDLNYLLVSLFCNLVHFFSYLYFVVLSSLPCFQHSGKSGYAIPKIICHILVRANQAKLFSNKIFPLNSVLQIVRSMVLS